MIFRLFIATMALSASFAGSVFAKPLAVVTTLPELAEMVRDIGQGEVTVKSLLAGTEDAHYLDAQPNFIREVANADMVCMIGLELETSWLGKILSRSGNAAVQPGGRGFCDTGTAVTVLEKPHGALDRSAGHVHPAGNPHFNLSPIALAQAASVVHGTLVGLRPSKAALFAQGVERFKTKMAKIDSAIKAKFDAYLKRHSRPPVVLEYHKEFAYFLNAYNIQSAGAIESLPGVPPSASRLAQVALKAKQQKVTIAIGSTFCPLKHLQQFQRLSGVPYARVPTMVQRGSKTLGTIAQLQNYLAQVVLDAHMKVKKPRPAKSAS